MKKKALLVLIPFAALALGSCSCTPSDPSKKQCSEVAISFKKQEITIGIDQPTVIPFEDVDCQGSINWKSSDESVVTIDDNGKLVGHKEGDAVITANGAQDGLTVHVKDGYIPPEESSLKEAYEACEATDKETDEYEFSGVFVGSRINGTQMDYYVQDGHYGIDVFVHEAIEGYAIGKQVTVAATLQKFSGAIETKTISSIKVGDAGTLPSATVIDSAAKLESCKQNVSVKATGTIASIGSVTDGTTDVKIQLEVGSDQIQIFFKKNTYASNLETLKSLAVGDEVTFDRGVKSVYATKDSTTHQFIACAETTIQKGSEPVGPKLMLDKSSATVEVESTVNVTAIVLNTEDPVVWTIDNPSVATVSSSGKVATILGVSKGTAILKATVAGLEKTCNITVKDKGEITNQIVDAYNKAASLSSGATSTEVYHIEGVAVAKRGTKDIFIQSDGYGIDLYDSGKTVTVGNKYAFDAKVKNYNNTYETNSVANFEDKGVAALPAAVQITSAADLDATKQNVLAKASGVVKEIGAVPTGSNDVTFTITVGSDDLAVFFKGGQYAALKDKIAALVAGDEVQLDNFVTGQFKTTKQLLAVDSSTVEVNKEEKTVISVDSIASGIPESIYVGGSITASSVVLNVTYEGGEKGTEHATSIALDTSVEAQNVIGKAFYGDTLYKEFTIDVVAKPADPVVGKTFVKVTSQADLTEGTYILGSNGKFFHGADEADKSIAATETDNTVVGLAGMAGLEISETTGGYSLKLINGANKDKYMSSNSGNDKTISFNESPAAHTISFESGVPTIGCGDKFLKFNDQSGQNRFRYYASGQKDVALYKLGETKKVESVTISGLLTKPTQYVGDTFDPTGLTVTAMYEGGETAVVTDKATWSVGELTEPNSGLEVTASFGGETSNAITVVVEAVSLTSMEIVVSETVKKNYVVGDAWSSQGISVKGHYNNGSEATLNAEDYELSYEPTAPAMGVTEVEVTATHKTADLTPATTTITGIVVTAEAQPELASIAVKTNPSKMTYNEGETFAPAGLVITASYTLDKAPEDKAWGTDGLTYSYTGPLKAPSATVTISYTEGGVTKDTTLTITVNSVAKHGTTEDDPLSTDEAYALAESLGSGGATTEKYYVEGYVTEIETAYSSQFGNITLQFTTSAGKIFKLYRATCTPEEANKIEVGTYVEVYGIIKNYSGTMETDAGGAIVKIENKLAKLEISGDEQLQIEDTATYTVTGLPVSADLGTVTWSIESGAEYISLPETKTGSSIEVTGVAEGTAVIKATSGSIDATFDIAVTAEAPVVEKVYKTGTFTRESFDKNSTDYASGSFKSTTAQKDGSNFVVNFQNAANNNKQWDCAAFGSKNADVTAIMSVGSIDVAISSITMSFDLFDAANVTSVIAYASSDGNTWTKVGELDSSAFAAGDQTIKLSNTAANMSYKIEFSVKKSSNARIKISAAAFNYIPK